MKVARRTGHDRRRPGRHVRGQLAADDERLPVQVQSRARAERQAAGRRHRADEADAAVNLEVREDAGRRAAVARQDGRARADDRPSGVGVVRDGEGEAVRIDGGAGLHEQVAHGDVAASASATTVIAAENVDAIGAACGTPRGLQLSGFDQSVSAPFHAASKPAGTGGSIWINSGWSSSLPFASTQRTVKR